MTDLRVLVCNTYPVLVERAGLERNIRLDHIDTAAVPDDHREAELAATLMLPIGTHSLDVL